MSQLLRDISREFIKEVSARSREIYELLFPPVDIFEDGSELVVVMDLPGFERDRISVRLERNALRVSAKRDPIERDGPTYWEQRPLVVNRRIPLPVEVKMEEDVEIKAKYENGVLTVRLPIKGIGRISIE